ncbi:structure-specific endonuclease subunit slx1-like [Branchiostoma lanceolatum]|uniref:structure-specific endonuclease subunit slx1-like n=1 Tax=Branchiostoma lanceolatum TaxID=7740 RepID=UPI003454E758
MMVVEIENFYGVYLLYCINPKYKGRTYIGFTNDPNRRIKQHNTGTKAGGARRTSGRGPWEMVLIIHGFPNNISALRFEWAWQHPDKSRRLRHLPKKSSKETAFQHKFRLVSNMLRVGPWCKLPLTIRWLKQEYMLEFDPLLQPPNHMPIAYGPVQSKRLKKNKAESVATETQSSQDDDDDFVHLSQGRVTRCDVCVKRLQEFESQLKCVHPSCTMKAHLTCLARHFLRRTEDSLLPVEGTCPKCKVSLLWGEVIRQKLGCQDVPQDSDDKAHWADEV